MIGNDRMLYQRGASQSATFVVAASDSLHQGYADYVCDGVDDQAEIQAAVNNTGDIYFMGGNYSKSNVEAITIPSNTHLTLAADAKIMFVNDVGDGAVIFANADAGGNENIAIVGGILDGNRANQSSGEQSIIKFVKVSSSKINSLMVNARSHYVEMSDCVGVEVINRQYPLSKEISEFISEQEINFPNALVDELESGWTFVNAVYDTTNFYSGNGSIKFTASDAWTNVAYVQKTLSPARDFSRAVFWAVLNFGNATCTELNTHNIILYAPDESNRLEYEYYAGCLRNLKNTWFAVPFIAVNRVGNPDLTNVTQILVRAIAHEAETAITWVDKIFITYSSLGKGMVTFSWDDGYDDVINDFAPIFDKYGYRSVAGIISTQIGLSGRMTISDIETLQNRGWDIVNHSWAHTDLSGKTEAEAEDDVRKGQDWLIVNGFQKGARFFIYPYSSTEEIGYNVVNKYHLMARVANGIGQSNPFPFFQRGMVFATGIAEGTLEDIKATIDVAFNEGLWLNLFGHQTSDTSPVDLDDLLSYINDKGMPVVTFSDVWDKYMRVPISMSGTSEIFLDVLAASTDAVHAAITGNSAEQEITAGITNPDVARNISIANSANSTGDVTIEGIDAKGNSVSEAITIMTGGTAYGDVAFTTVTKITIPATVATPDTISVGISDKLGLSKIIYNSGDVYKVKKNNADATVGTVNATYGTVDCATITSDDDFTIWYKSNLNIIN